MSRLKSLGIVSKGSLSRNMDRITLAYIRNVTTDTMQAKIFDLVICGDLTIELTGASGWRAGCPCKPRDGRVRRPVERLVRVLEV